MLCICEKYVSGGLVSWLWRKLYARIFGLVILGKSFEKLNYFRESFFILYEEKMTSNKNFAGNNTSRHRIRNSLENSASSF